MKLILSSVLILFVIFCGYLVIETGLFTNCPADHPCILLQTTEDGGQTTEAKEPPQLQASTAVSFGADNAEAAAVTLGSIDPAGGYKFQLELTSRGAAIAKATFSEFDDRDYKDPQPLVILSPINGDVLSMANKQLVFVEHNLQLSLDKLHWKSLGVETDYDGSQTARFETIIKEKNTGQATLKLVKTYKVKPDSYHFDCSITVENLSADEQKVRFNLAGPGGLDREGVRADMRKTVACFRNAEGQNTSTRIDLRKFDGKKTFDEKELAKDSDRFLWIAAVNKYFAAILVPLPDDGKDMVDWVASKTGRLYNPDAQKTSGDENLNVNLKIASAKLAAAGQFDSAKTYNFLLYLGPKDKSLFDKTDLYKNLGFVHTIDFMACCCPAAIINPLAFGILAMMKWMYGFIGNYGIVIIILVFLVRLCLHPVTKKSQVSMSRYTKIMNSPEAAQIKAKYAKNRMEMQKNLSAYMKDQGVSPATAVTGMLPMMVQMPIWIALYSAIYASTELRGAPFLPFWITDLSAPDALVRFTAIELPIFGKIDSFNLLPILMGVAFYLQQKLTPQPSAAADSQVAQQQKMMMIMMPIMFPLMLYKAPSGLNLYIMSSVSAGAVEQYYIRKHIREKDQAESQGLVAVTSKTGGKVKKKKPKPFYKM